MKMIKYAKIRETGDIETTLVDPTNQTHLEIVAASGFLPLVYEDDETESEELSELGSTERRFRIEEDRIVRYNEQVAVAPEKVRAKIEGLCAVLAASDYKVLKCQEQALAGEALSYDIVELHSEREATRVEIRGLRALLGE